MRKKPLNRRRKGLDWEREIARELKEFYPRARRGRQQLAHVPDVDVPLVWIEAKNRRDLGYFRDAWAEAVTDADHDSFRRWPVVVYKLPPTGRPRRRRAYALMRWTDLDELAAGHSTKAASAKGTASRPCLGVQGHLSGLEEVDVIRLHVNNNVFALTTWDYLRDCVLGPALRAVGG